MKQIMEKNKKTYAILVAILVIIIGIIVTVICGFNKELKYQQSQSIDIYLEQEFDESEIKQIANDILGKKNMIEIVEIYSDMVTIRSTSITEEQKNDLVNRVKESYEFSQTAEDISIKDIPATKIIDMYKPYVLPFIISGALVLVYMIIRYYKVGTLKVLARTVLIPIISELLLLSIIAITRIPMGRFIPVFFVTMYIGTILYVTKQNEKDNENNKENKKD